MFKCKTNNSSRTSNFWKGHEHACNIDIHAKFSNIISKSDILYVFISSLQLHHFLFKTCAEDPSVSQWAKKTWKKSTDFRYQLWSRGIFSTNESFAPSLTDSRYCLVTKQHTVPCCYGNWDKSSPWPFIGRDRGRIHVNQNLSRDCAILMIFFSDLMTLFWYFIFKKTFVMWYICMPKKQGHFMMNVYIRPPGMSTLRRITCVTWTTALCFQADITFCYSYPWLIITFVHCSYAVRSHAQCKTCALWSTCMMKIIAWTFIYLLPFFTPVTAMGIKQN